MLKRLTNMYIACDLSLILTQVIEEELKIVLCTPDCCKSVANTENKM